MLMNLSFSASINLKLLRGRNNVEHPARSAEVFTHKSFAYEKL